MLTIHAGYTVCYKFYYEVHVRYTSEDLIIRFGEDQLYELLMWCAAFNYNSRKI
jgi:hypothetical protein